MKRSASAVIVPAGEVLPNAPPPYVAGGVGVGAILVAITALAACAALLLWLIVILLPVAVFLAAVAIMAFRAPAGTGRRPLSILGA